MSLTAGVQLCRSPSASTPRLKVSAVATVSVRIYQHESLDFLPSPVAHRPGEYLFVCNQELIFLPLFVLYHYTQIAFILHLQPAASACEECCNLLFACCWLWSVFSLFDLRVADSKREISPKSLPSIQSVTCLKALVIITSFRRLLELTAVAIHKLISPKLCLPWTEGGV